MDFFDAQERARRRTTRLVVLFVLAVLALIAGGYFVAVFLLLQVEAPDAWLTPGGEPRYTAFRPDVLFWVALGTVSVVGLAAGYKWLTFRSGGEAVARMLGGTAVDPSTTDFKERQLLNVVEEMAIASGTPLPAVYVLHGESGINAFAAGLTTSDAVVAVTRGALEHLTREELQGVVAHEFSHILNGDMRLNLKLASTVFGILVIGLIGRMLLHVVSRARFATRGRSSRDGQGLVAVVAVCVVGGLALMIIGYSGYFFGRLIQAAVSRQREYLADASAVQFTRNPPGLLGALRKIGGLSLGARVMAPAASQFHHAFFGQAFRSFTGLLATHPPLEERIRAIDPRGTSAPLEATRAPQPSTPVPVAGLSPAMPQPSTPVPVAGLSPAMPQPSVPVPAAGVSPAMPQPSTPVPAAGVPRRAEGGSGARVAVTVPMAAVHSIGAPGAAHVDYAHAFLEGLPPALFAAAHDPRQAPALVYALLVDGEPGVRDTQLAVLGQQQPEALAWLHPLLGPLTGLPTAARLPLLQLAIGALRGLSGPALERFLATIAALIHADARVTPFELALQKLVTRHLHRAHHPAHGGHEVHSLNALAEPVATVLSTLAFLGSTDAAAAQHAFSSGVAHLGPLSRPIALQPRELCTLTEVDAALDQLARLAFPIKKRVIRAAAHVVGADGRLDENEAEMLRAVSAILDCPMPPIVEHATHTAVPGQMALA